MTLGLGIFLSAFFLGTIYLYGQTKDRWNWKENTTKPKINNVQNQSEETVVSSLKDDGFDHIRKKGKLKIRAERL